MAGSQGFEIKYLLAAMAFQDPARFKATFSGETGLAYLRDLWDGLGLGLPQEARVSSSSASLLLTDGIVLLRLPAPQTQNEPFAIAVVTADVPRVFFLEKAVIPGLPQITAMVAEVSRGTRSNLGPLGATDDATFLDRVREVVGKI